MAGTSFLNLRHNISRKSMPSKTTRFTSMSKETQRSSSDGPKLHYQANAEEMKTVFEKFDVNKDGRISLEEYKLAQRALGGGNRGGAEAAKVFRIADSDGDGFLDFEEFMKVQNTEGGIKASDIAGAFRVFDLDGDGKISAEEVFEVLRRLGERCSLDACRKMVKGADSNGDGLIDIAEFMSMMTQSMTLIS